MVESSAADIQRRTHALKRVARALIGEEHGAEDAVQAAWLAALEAPPRVLSLAWLRRVVLSRARDERRRRALRSAREVDESLPASQLDAAEAAQQLELSARLAAGLAALRDPYRTALYLRYFEDLTPPEIASRLAEPLATVKTRLRRGLSLLRAELGVEGEETSGRGRTHAGLVLLAGLPRRPSALAPLTWFPLVTSMKKLITVAVGLVVALAAAWFVLQERFADRPEPEGLNVSQVQAQLMEPAEATVVTPVEIAARESLEVRTASSAASLPNTGELVVLVTWHDGSPAANIDISIEAAAQAAQRSSAASAITDESGRVEFFDLKPQEWLVLTDRGTGSLVAIEAGQSTRLDMQLERGVDVSGRVTDTGGVPIPGAAIRITTGRGDWATERISAYSDASGAYCVRSLGAERSLGVFADGFMPSACVDLEQHKCVDARATVDFTLTPGGARLIGRIVDGTGRPVGGAIVALGDPESYESMRLDGTAIDDAGPRIERSDIQGRFEFLGLAPGQTPVTVRAEGFAVQRGEIQLAANQSSELAIQVFQGAQVSGVVRDAGGQPRGGAFVCAFDTPLPTDFLGSGQIDFARVFGYVQATSDAQGRFQLAHLPPGQSYLYAFERRNLQGIGSVMRAEHMILLEDGQQAIWDPILERGHRIYGVVEYADGSPVAHSFVSAVDESSGRISMLPAGEDGCFEFLNLASSTYTVFPEVFDAPAGSAPPERRGVAVDGDELVLRLAHVPKSPTPRGSVSFRFVDSGGRIPEGAALSASLHDPSGFRPDALRNGTAFSFDDVAADTYHVVVWSSGNPIARSPTFTIASGEQLDLGTLASVPGGALTLAIERSADARGVSANLHLTLGDDLHHEPIAIGAMQEQVTIENLTPGRLRGTLQGDRLLTQRLEVEIVAFETAAAQVRLAGGAACTFEVKLAALASNGELALIVGDQTGAVVHKARRGLTLALGNPVSMHAQLPLGDYSYSLSLSGSDAVKGKFTIAEFGPLTIPVDLADGG